MHALNPEPWGVANGYAYAKKLGIENKVISFNYGRIEGEPSFPLTNFGPGSATTTDHIPTPPMVDSSSVTAKRIQAYGDSVLPRQASSCSLAKLAGACDVFIPTRSAIEDLSYQTMYNEPRRF